MQVIRQETSSGNLTMLTFARDPAETEDQFKAAVKAWRQANIPSISWEKFFDRMESMDSMSLRIKMV